MTKQVNEILATLQEFKWEVVKALTQISREYEKLGSSYNDARAFVSTIVAAEDLLGRDTTKDLITEVALTHKLHVSVGSYGNGESLQLEDYRWSGRSAGDWVSSSENC